MDDASGKDVDNDEDSPFPVELPEEDPINLRRDTPPEEDAVFGRRRPGLNTGLSLDDTYLHQALGRLATDEDPFTPDGDDGRCVRTAPPSPAKKVHNRSGANSKKQSLTSRLDPKISTIRQHYYPEGGWGWIICACGFVINMLTTGLLLSYGVLYVEVVKEFGDEYATEAMWLGSLSLSTGLFLSPLIVAFCRRKSTRLTAVFGGLTSALGCLFTSFASQLHQVFFSYGVVMAVGLGVARETSNLMTGQYFKRRRECVELIVQSGTGMGVAIFSFTIRTIMRILGWRLGLHAVTGIVVLPFFVGICYRSASLYHPQRRAILHLKNQRKKVKDKSAISDKPPFFDFTSLRIRSLQITMMATALCSFGLYAPFFYFVPVAEDEGLEQNSILLLQLFVGSAFSLGCWVFGFLVIKRNAQCMIARQYLCQAAMIGLGVSLLSVCAVHGYHGYVLFVWLYGIFCGGIHYTLKMFLFEKIRAKNFNRAWGFVEWSQSIPVLVGIPVTGYINKSQGPKTGFFFSAACAFAGAAAFFLMNVRTNPSNRRGQGSCSTCTSQAPSELPRDVIADGGICTCNNSLHSNSTHASTLTKCQRTISFATAVDVAEDPKRPELLTCISEEGLVDLGDLNVLDEWCDDECISPCTRDNRYLMINEYENNIEDRKIYGEDGKVPLTQTFSDHTNYDCQRIDNYDPIILHLPKRPMTVIEEVTSTV